MGRPVYSLNAVSAMMAVLVISGSLLIIQDVQAEMTVSSGLSEKVSTGAFKKTIGDTKYDLWVPSSYGHTDREFPLVIALHFSSGRGIDMIERWKEAAEKRNIIVAAPDSQDRWLWKIPGEEQAVFKVIEDVKSAYHVDEKRIYLFGFSYGANLCYYMGLHYPQMFRAIVAFSGIYRWVEMYEPSGSSAKKVPFFILNGKEDIRVEPKEAEYAKQRLTHLGYPVKMMILSGVDHQYPAETTWLIVNWFDRLEKKPNH